MWRVVKPDATEFSHYGVKGMRWGVRKDDDSKATRKSSKTSVNENGIAKTTITTHGEDIYEEFRKENKRIIDFERNTIHTPNFIASKKLDNLPKINNRLSEDLEAWKVNKGAPTQSRKLNCFECTVAYEMRNRGYDVQANEKHGGTLAEYIHAFDVKDSFTLSVTNRADGVTDEQYTREFYNQIASQCLAYGDGARGNIGVYWPLGGGHAMSWYVEDGEFHLIDPQDTSRDAVECLSNCNGKAEVFRLDNAELLPGAVDFVEPYKSPGKVTIKKKVEKLIKKLGKDVSKLIEEGSKFIEKLFKRSK